MAFRSTAKRKEVKKSSYYVWFLGAKESHGLRGDAYIRPGLRYLVEREREIEPIKVTLQVSNKGLKIVQNMSTVTSKQRKNGVLSTSKGETIKHFIPHDAITCVVQGDPPGDDLVACILLLYNPVTRCPVHVHAYRCDSVETASVLRRQLEALSEHPDTERKMAELEAKLDRLGNKGYHIQHTRQPGTSDGRSTRDDSESSGSEREVPFHQGLPALTAQSQPLDERTAHLYASLAAELRDKLQGGKSKVPILLPPRDYDTVHRNRGKLDGIESRKSMQVSVVGPNGLFTRRARPSDHPKDDSSGKSSGIGSDEAPSSPPRGHRSVSSSEDEWEAQKELQARAVREMLQRETPSSNDEPRVTRISRMQVISNVESQDNCRDHKWQKQPVPFRVLPRVSPKSPTRPTVYQELPEDKRYPGLDRESARSHYLERRSHSTPQTARMSYYESDKRQINQQRFSYTEPNEYNNNNNNNSNNNKATHLYSGRRRSGPNLPEY